MEHFDLLDETLKDELFFVELETFKRPTGMFWAGEYVSTQLNVSIDNAQNQILNVEDTVGLAIRNNPKRAHLLVSKILGKYIPVPASTIVRSGQILALRASNALQGRTEAVDAYLHELKETINTPKVLKPLPDHPPVEAVVLGYAETATSLGHIVADYLKAPYIHSTRYGDHAVVPYGRFEEAHSHATSHQLIPRDKEFLNNSRPLILVDDELSTGNTLMATIDELHALSPRNHYVVCTLIDCRSKESKAKMQAFADKLGVKIEVVYLSVGTVSYPETILDDVKEVIANMPIATPNHVPSNPEVKILQADFTGYVNAKYGVNTCGDTAIAKNIVDAIHPREVTGKTLVLGTEEFMYLPLQVSAEMEYRGFDGVYSSSTTRAPVLQLDNDEYAIKHKITYRLPNGDERFIYNASGFETVIIVVDPSLETTDFLGEDGLVAALSFDTVRKIILVEQGK